MNVTEAITRRDPSAVRQRQVRCDCATKQSRGHWRAPLAEVYHHQGHSYLWVLTDRPRSSLSGEIVQRPGRVSRRTDDPEVYWSEVVRCRRCRTAWLLTNRPMSELPYTGGYIVTRYDLPREDPGFAAGQHVDTYEYPTRWLGAGGSVRYARLGRPVRAQVAA